MRSLADEKQVLEVHLETALTVDRSTSTKNTCFRSGPEMDWGEGEGLIGIVIQG